MLAKEMGLKSGALEQTKHACTLAAAVLFVRGTMNKIAMSYNTDMVVWAANSGNSNSFGTDTSATIPTVSSMVLGIGIDGGGQRLMHIRRIKFSKYPYQVSTLRSLTVQ